MAMNDQQLIDYVRAQTKVRAVQVADKFDVDLEDARERLNALVDAGDLRMSDGFSPNGMACKVYDVVATTRPGVGTVQQSSVPAVAQVIAASPLRLAPPSMQGGRTKVQCAIDYLADKGEAAVEDLRVVMDLDRHMSPTSYLGAAIRDGRIVKDGNMYRLGDGKPVGRNASRQPRTQPPQLHLERRRQSRARQCKPLRRFASASGRMVLSNCSVTEKRSHALINAKANT